MFKEKTRMTKQRGVNVQLLPEYKSKLDKVAYELTGEVEERVTTTKVIYTLIDNFLDDAKEIIKKEY